jgi:hypothetical protein
VTVRGVVASSNGSIAISAIAVQQRNRCDVLDIESRFAWECTVGGGLLHPNR